MFAIALEDDLAQELCKFKQQKNYDDKIVERILYHYKAPILVSQEYMKEYYSDEATLSPILGANNNIDFERTLEELATTQTLYKIILSKNRSEFPFVNIFKDKLENNFTATFKSGELRTKAVKHFTSLFYNAQSIFIFDKYIKRTGLEYLIRECQINEYVDEIKIVSSNIAESNGGIQQDTEIMGINVQVVANNQNYSRNNTHDRYIKIDDKIEIILTSGLDNFQNTSKDFTYIIREIKIE